MGLTNAELAERSGVPLGTINKILSGATKDPKLETLKYIAGVLGLTLNDFDDSVINKNEPTYDDVETLIIKTGKNMSKEQKLHLIQLLSEIK